MKLLFLSSSLLLSLLLCPASSCSSTTIPSDFGPDFEPSQLDNMNGKYPLSSTPNVNTPPRLPSQFKDYPGGVESFDVYSPPMTTLYSQVWWTPLAPVDLPAHVVTRYKNKGMAIVGYEIDQVMRLESNENGDIVDVSVPISVSYNHHYVSRLIGQEAHFRKVKLQGPDDPLAHELLAQQQGCGGTHIQWDQPQYLVQGPAVSKQRHLPTRQFISSGNGGEFRKTFHGFSPPHAMVIDSPTQLQIYPMQIDTWNREHMHFWNTSAPTKFVPGPEPRASLAPKHGALHSGLLECPMTTRLTKVVDSATYALQGDNSGVCEQPILTFYECFQAAATTVTTSAKSSRKMMRGPQNKPMRFCNETGSDPNLPSGCLVLSNDDDDDDDDDDNTNTVRVFFNEYDQSDTPCSQHAKCVCATDQTPFGQATGALLYHPTNQSVDTGSGKADYFHPNKCAAWPHTSILEQKNPTCDIRHYQGGQWACSHMWSLLDADQEIPWPDQPLVFHHKYRFWVQPYDETYHQPVTLGETAGSALLLGSPWEFDVPKCAANVPGCKRVVNDNDGSIMWVHTIQGSMMGHHSFVTLNNHCHAPTCLSTAVYACPKGTALEDCNPTTGRLICETKPIYGGTGHPDLHGTRFDEPGYIAVPVCVWGSADFGLAAPLDLEGVPLHVVKKSNATEGHYGEMSGGQPWVLGLGKVEKHVADNAKDAIVRVSSRN